VVDSGEPLPKNWKPKMPDMTTVDLILVEEE
jgi:hypothetical protein